MDETPARPSWPHLRLIAEAATELLWPTRCALCDRPEHLLCDSCRRHLPYVEPLRACPVCGAPFGKTICTECNAYTRSVRGIEELPLDGIRSVCLATKATTRIVTTYKDKHEKRLAHVMASLMADVMPASWKEGACLVPIPARAEALRQRGFDHMGMVCGELATLTGVPTRAVLEHGWSKDQRTLGAQERQLNVSQAFRIKKGALPDRVILVDDVLTTGATLRAAAQVLKRSGVTCVYAVTLLRA